MDENLTQDGGAPLPPPPPNPGLASDRPIGPVAPTQAGAGSRNAGWLVLAGGALVVAGVFLPWIQASTAVGSVSANGIRIGTFGTLLLGGFAVARGFSMVRPDMFRMRLGTPVIGGVLILVLMALRWGYLQGQIRIARATVPGIQVSLGLGVWAVIVGGLLVIVGGLIGPRRAHLRARLRQSR